MFTMWAHVTAELMKITARNAAGSSCGQQTTQGACVSNRAVEDRGRRLNQSHLRPMAEISLLPSANTRKRASACREQWTWTFLVSKRSASVKYTTVVGVKLWLFRVYIESLTISSQEPGEKNPNEITDYFVCTANAHAWVSCILCQDTPARTIWKNTKLIMALNHE